MEHGRKAPTVVEHGRLVESDCWEGFSKDSIEKLKELSKAARLTGLDGCV